MSTKNIKLFLIVRFFCFLNLFAQSDQHTLATVTLVQAQQKMQQGDYERAIALYDQMSEKNAAIYHDLAQCFFKQKNYVATLLSCRRAYRLNPHRGEIASLLEFEQKSLEKLKLKQYQFWYYFLLWLVVLIPMFVWQLLILIFLMLILWILYQRLCGILYKKLFIGCFAMLMMLGAVWYIHRQILRKTYAFVVKDDVIVYAGPDKDFHQLSRLKLGTQVDVLMMHNNMIKIRKNKQFGWIFSDEIEII